MFWRNKDLGTIISHHMNEYQRKITGTEKKWSYAQEEVKRKIKDSDSI